MRWKWKSGKKPDEGGEHKQPKKEVKPDVDAVKKTEIQPDIQLQKPKSVGGLKAQDQDSFKAAKKKKVDDLIQELTQLEKKLAKGVAAIKKDGPEKLTPKSFEGDLSADELTEFIDSADVNKSGVRIMQGQLLKFLSTTKGGPERMPTYVQAIANLNKKLNAKFNVGLEENPKQIKIQSGIKG